MNHYYVCYLYAANHQLSYSFAVQSNSDEFDPASFVKSIQEMKKAEMVIIQNWIRISDYQKHQFEQLLNPV